MRARPRFLKLLRARLRTFVGRSWRPLDWKMSIKSSRAENLSGGPGLDYGKSSRRNPPASRPGLIAAEAQSRSAKYSEFAERRLRRGRGSTFRGRYGVTSEAAPTPCSELLFIRDLAGGGLEFEVRAAILSTAVGGTRWRPDEVDNCKVGMGNVILCRIIFKMSFWNKMICFSL